MQAVLANAISITALVAASCAWLAHPAALRKDEPSMQAFRPDTVRAKGVVIAAPHDGYDLNSGDIARKLGDELGAVVLVARDYRDTKAGRYINVNRPTACALDAEKQPGPERESPEAKAVFEQWVAKLRELGELPLPLYVEIHGHVHKVKLKGEQVPLDVIEVATVGIARADAEKLALLWEARRKQEPELAPMRFDVSDGEYEYRGEKRSFYFRATSTKESGILAARYVKRALHFELPESARKTVAARRAVSAGIADLLRTL